MRGDWFGCETAEVIYLIYTLDPHGCANCKNKIIYIVILKLKVIFT